MLNSSIGYEIFCALFLLGLASVLIYFFYKENQRAKERHKTYIESLKSLSHSFKEIQVDFQFYVGQYIKNSQYK